MGPCQHLVAPLRHHPMRSGFAGGSFDLRCGTSGLRSRLRREHRFPSGSGGRDVSTGGPELAWHRAFVKSRPNEPVPHPNGRLDHRRSHSSPDRDGLLPSRSSLSS